MSLFQKIFKGLHLKPENEEDQHSEIIESISNQIYLLFNNRSDVYWAFDFKKQVSVPIHEVFQLNYSSAEFIKKLEGIIEVCEPRITDIKILIIYDNNKKDPQIILNCKLKSSKESLAPIILKI